MNVLWLLLQTNNIFYRQKVHTKGDHAKKIDELFKGKTLQNDFEEFKKVLMNHSIDRPPGQVKYFEANEVKKIIDYAKNGYFAHFNLYTYIFCNKQKNEEIRMTVFIDNPLPNAPLSEALYMGKEKHEIKEDDDAEMKKEQEEKKKKEEEQRIVVEKIAQQKKEDEENTLDPKTMQVIQFKIRETQALMEKQLEEREKMLQEKLTSLDPKAKKK